MLRFTLCLAALLVPAIVHAEAPVTLTAYAGIFRDNHTAVVANHFGAAQYAEGRTSAQKASPQTDVVIMDVTTAALACAEGLVQRITPADVPILAELDPMARSPGGECVALLEQTETATVGHWRHWGFVDHGVQALLRDRRAAGIAVTVQIPGPDSTLLHHAPGLLRPGDVLMVDRLGDTRQACRGGGVTVAAKAGVVDGPCTDLEEVEASDFPLRGRGLAPITTRIDDLGGRLNVPVTISGATAKVLAGA